MSKLIEARMQGYEAKLVDLEAQLEEMPASTDKIYVEIRLIEAFMKLDVMEHRLI